MKQPAKKTGGAAKDFPRPGMAYQDRFRMTIGKFGREIKIEVNRGKIRCIDDATAIIEYHDSKVRGPRKKSP